MTILYQRNDMAKGEHRDKKNRKKKKKSKKFDKL